MRATIFLFFSVWMLPSWAQIRVNPTGVNVNASGATVVFLSYGGLQDYVPADAVWCGDLVSALPDFGERCNPSTIFGHLPLRHDLSSLSGAGGFTDVMSIPPSVARRAYQAASAGDESRFFYVRRFVHPFSAAPDVYVAVTCRLAGSGARTPFALLDVQLSFEIDEPVLSLAQGTPAPPLFAEISYNGTGLLRGRWEVVRPGDEPPSTHDLLTEATLPIEERGLQRRYTELDRFSVFLPPSTGARFILPGPDRKHLPTDVDGIYQVLLRIEAADDKEGDSNLSAVGSGAGVVHAGAVAGFPIPPLRYFVGGGAPRIAGKLYSLAPDDGFMLAPAAAVDFSWTDVPHAVLYRLEVDDSHRRRILDALLPPGLLTYRAPSWLHERTGGSSLRWRVAALGPGGRTLAHTPWRVLKVP